MLPVVLSEFEGDIKSRGKIARFARLYRLRLSVQGRAARSGSPRPHAASNSTRQNEKPADNLIVRGGPSILYWFKLRLPVSALKPA